MKKELRDQLFGNIASDERIELTNDTNGNLRIKRIRIHDSGQTEKETTISAKTFSLMIADDEMIADVLWRDAVVVRVEE